MGCTSSSQIDRAGEEDLVGGVGRTVDQVKAREVPEERDAMVALEVAASRRTVYRKRMRKFLPNGDLDYNASNTKLHLRNLLDEPVGRFYLKDFAREKKLPEMVKLLDGWVTIQHLKGPKDLSLETVMKVAEQEDAEKAATEQVKTSSSARPLTGAAKDKDADKQDDADEPVGADETGDKTLGDGKAAEGDEPETLYGYPVEYPSEAELEEMTNKLLKEMLAKDGELSLHGLVDDTLIEETRSAAAGALERKDFEVLRTTAFVPLQNALFLKLLEDGHHQKFREHSEYKRWKLKYQKCYNTISHRDFDFMATLGKGSFGRVIRVRKKTTGQEFALKVMSKKKILSGAESTEQVTIERNVLVTCTTPSVVKPHFAFQTSRALFLALELLEGGTLMDAMKNNMGGVLQEDQTCFITAQMVLGLEHLHKHGILYRDLKPANVMLDRRGNAVLTDMGLAAKFRDSEFPKEDGGLSSSGNRMLRRKSMPQLKPEELKCVGTFGYRAPEVLAVSENKKGYGPGVDYWALGVTVYYLMYAKLPFSKKAGRKSLLGPQLNVKEQEKRLHKEPLNLPKEMSESARTLVEGLLAMNPDDRLGRDVAELKAHPFFASIDWDRLERRKLQPVYRPRVAKRLKTETPAYDGLAEAMQQFSQDNVLELFGGENEMNDEYTHVGRSQQRLFRDWDYIPDELLEPDWERVGEAKLFP